MVSGRIVSKEADDESGPLQEYVLTIVINLTIPSLVLVRYFDLQETSPCRSP